MKFNKAIALLTVLALGTVSVGVVKADDLTDEKNTTTAGVELIVGGGVQLTTAPSLEFGQHTLAGEALSLSPTNTTDPITVVNPGLADGWTVFTSITPFTTTPAEGETVKELKGALLTFATPTITNAEGSEETDGNVSATTPFVFADALAPIFTAIAGSGIGTYTATYNNEKVITLAIPSTATPGNYSATMNWSLSNAPDGSEPEKAPAGDENGVEEGTDPTQTPVEAPGA